MIETNQTLTDFLPELPSRIETSRLVLRPLAKTDCHALVAICNDRTLAQMMATIPYPYTMKNAEEFVEKWQTADSKIKTRLAITLKDSDELLGTIGCGLRQGRLDLGYFVGRFYRRRGFASEAAIAFITQIFDSGEIEEITASARTINDASQALLTKLGFEETDTGLVRSISLGGSVPTIKYRLTLNAFVQKQAAAEKSDA